METLANNNQNSKNFKKGIVFLVGFILVMWLIKALEMMTNIALYELGVYPRTISGLFGILLGPLLHSDIFHLLSNSIPIAIMGVLLLMVYRKYALDVFIVIYLLSGFILWIIGRDSYHIGASGLVYGLFGFIFLIGFLLKDNNSMLVSTGLFFLYGGVFYGIFPDRPEVSWEAHLSGLFIGFVTALVFSKRYKKANIKESSVENVNCNFTKTDTIFTYEYIEPDSKNKD